MSNEVFDHCPRCEHKSFFSTTTVYKCPDCYCSFCNKCCPKRFLSFLFGYKCPKCTLHISATRLSELKIGFIPWDKGVLFALGSISLTTIWLVIQIAIS